MGIITDRIRQELEALKQADLRLQADWAALLADVRADIDRLQSEIDSDEELA
mgnify:CR=1 FL=1